MPPVPETFDHSKIDFRSYYYYATLLNVPPILLMYPFRTVRLLQQSKSAVPVSPAVLKVMHEIVRKKGFLALYAGSTIYTTGLTTTKILQFATYDYTGQLIKQNKYFGLDSLRNQKLMSVLLGSFSAVITVFFVVPFNMISQQIAVAKAGTLSNASNIPIYVTGSYEPLGKVPAMTIAKSLKSQFQQEGVRFLFRGYCATLFATGPFFAVYFPAYEMARLWMHDKIDYIRDVQAARPGPVRNNNPFPPLSSHQFIMSSVAGSVASLTGVLVSSPFDMVKTRIQTEQRLQPTNASGVKLPLPSLKWADVFKEIWKKEGPMAFFSGTKARAILAVPAGALNFFIFDAVRSLSLKEEMPTPIQAERQVMLDTLYHLERQHGNVDRSLDAVLEENPPPPKARQSTPQAFEPMPRILLQQENI
ncbi:hypothetical protein BGZ94_008870 [Podila epigama]|nr:hypothetical protein BGZ94_008870 [Podila epigama]